MSAGSQPTHNQHPAWALPGVSQLPGGVAPARGAVSTAATGDKPPALRSGARPRYISRRATSAVLGALAVGALVAACAPAAAPSATPAQPPAAGSGAASSGASAKPAAPAPTAAPAQAAPVAAPSPPETVVIHTPGESLAGFSLSLAMDRGYLREEGLDASKQQMQTNTALAAMLAGEVDYSETIGSVSRAVVAQQAPLRIIHVAATGIGFSLMGGPQVRELSDLRGKAVGTYAPRDTSVIGLEVALRRFGLDLQRDDITIAPLNTDLGLFAGLATNNVAAVVIAPPYNFKAEKDLGARRFFDVSEYLQAAWTGLSTSTRKLSENPQQVRRMLRANLRAVDYIFANQAEVAGWIASHFDVEPDVAAKSLDQMLRLLSRDGTAPPEALEGLIELARQQAETTEAVSVEQVFDFRPLQEVRSR
jgi:ABC-type nitrate/sulfonate/bicarbonate transport system substrate-binding protein